MTHIYKLKPAISAGGAQSLSTLAPGTSWLPGPTTITRYAPALQRAQLISLTCGMLFKNVFAIHFQVSYGFLDYSI